MARKASAAKSGKATPAKASRKSVAQQLQDVLEENAKLRQAVEAQTEAAVVHQHRLATVHPHHRTPQSELMVGIRNISDTTVGLPKHLPGDHDIQLAGNFGPASAGTTAVVSYGHWRDLRKSDFVAKGLIQRDDSVLGAAYNAAPPDKRTELPDEHYVNAIVDPEEWIDSRTDTELKRDIEALTSDDSLRRLRRVVDDALRKAQESYPDRGRVEAAQRALRSLSAKLQLVDNLTTAKLEGGEDPDDAHPLGETELSRQVERTRFEPRTLRPRR